MNERILTALFEGSPVLGIFLVLAVLGFFHHFSCHTQKTFMDGTDKLKEFEWKIEFGPLKASGKAKTSDSTETRTSEKTSSSSNS